MQNIVPSTIAAAKQDGQATYIFSKSRSCETEFYQVHWNSAQGVKHVLQIYTAMQVSKNFDKTPIKRTLKNSMTLTRINKADNSAEV